ncbi:LPXTG cell wall anchor domain-containing protein [Actinokineospora soli]|uniref:LPXTG cell wall anchor domain-containing protein n=1 Tax=Actinokineospora soli TaxID=1048753 RepID=A0ABW2TJK7_9PSEU
MLAGPEDVLFSTQFVNLHEATAPVEVRIRGIVERGTTTTTTATSTTTTTATTTPGTSAPTTTTTTPAPQAGRPPLADTGANTSRLALGGVLVLAAGVAMVVLARRRRA